MTHSIPGRYLPLVILTSLLAACGQQNLPETQKVNTASSVSIESLVNEWIKVKDATYTSNSQILSSQSLTNQALKQANLEALAANKVGMKISSASSDIKIQSTSSGNKYYVNSITYIIYDKGEANNQQMAIGNHYEFTIENNSGNYSISNVKNVEFGDPDFGKFTEFLTPRKSFLASTEAQIHNNLQSQATGYYNGSTAARYAIDWAFGTNPNYIRYDIKQSDCTNFASQVLKAGGWSMVGYTPVISEFVRSNNANWFYENPLGQVNNAYVGGPSYTWSAAVNWSIFALNSGRMQVKSSINELQPGDIIQVDWDSSGVVQHTIIVSGIMSTGERTVAAHSNDHAQMPFSQFKQTAQDSHKGKVQRYVYYHVIATK